MEKSIFEQMGGTYTKVGDYYLPDLALPAEEQQPIGIWGQRHLRHIKQNRRALYTNLLTSGKLNSYLADINRHGFKFYFSGFNPADVQDIINQGQKVFGTFHNLFQAFIHIIVYMMFSGNICKTNDCIHRGSDIMGHIA